MSSAATLEARAEASGGDRPADESRSVGRGDPACTARTSLAPLISRPCFVPVSSPFSSLFRLRGRSKPRNGLVRSYDQHDDSVYAVAWSAGDPWIFASLSYDGQVVINTVPQDQKYKIIL